MNDLIRQRKSPLDLRIERQIVTGMVVSDRFLKEIQPMISGGGKFQADFSQKVAQWCIEYWSRYQKAPNKNIEDIFLTHKSNLQEDTAQLIEDFMTGLSEEYERAEGQFNVDYILDKAENHFRLASLKEFQTSLSKCISGGRFEDAENLIKEYSRPSRPTMRGVDPIRDKEFIRDCLKPDEENTDIILQLPGALGKATGPLERGFLMAFQAESGVGKTWWLWLVGKLGMMAGYNVLFFSLEMTEKKMGKRIWQDLMGAPIKPGKVKIPVFDCLYNQINTCTKRERKGAGLYNKDIYNPDWQPCDACRDKWEVTQVTTFMKEVDREVLEAGDALSKVDAMQRSGLLKKMGRVHLAEFPENSLTTNEMMAYANNLEYYDNFIIDIMLNDYADKNKWPIPNDPRNSIGQIWADHKRFAQEKHCLVGTASQSNTERSGKKVGKGSWSENIEKRRKLDLGIAINQNDDDYEKGIVWITIDKMRHGDKVVTYNVAVLQALQIGKPYLDSCFVRKKKKESSS